MEQTDIFTLSLHECSYEVVLSTDFKMFSCLE